MTGGLVSSTTLIQSLNENAPAYGLMVSLCVGFLGISVHAVIGLIKIKEEKRHNMEKERIEREKD